MYIKNREFNSWKICPGCTKRAIILQGGSDLIMIHSKENNPKEIFKFAKRFNKLKISCHW